MKKRIAVIAKTCAIVRSNVPVPASVEAPRTDLEGCVSVVVPRTLCVVEVPPTPPGVGVAVGPLVGVGVTVVVTDGVTVTDGVVVTVTEGVTVPLGVAVGVIVPDGVAVGVMVPLGVAVGVSVALGVAVGVTVVVVQLSIQKTLLLAAFDF